MASDRRLSSIAAAFCFAAAGLCFSATVASAATASGSFNVTATVASTCTVTATNIAFGAYVPTTASTANSTITATCTSLVTPSISLSLGNATALPRYMARAATPANHLPYALYQNVGLTTAWSSGATESVTMVGAVGTIIVYGQIPAGQYVPAATDYTDTINVTMTY
jgi:spore coat protein U-like protein